MLRRAARRVRAGSLLFVLACALGSGCAGGGVFKTRVRVRGRAVSVARRLGDLERQRVCGVARGAARRRSQSGSPGTRRSRRAARTSSEPRTPGSLSVSSRRDGRRFVHASVDVDDVRDAVASGAVRWSSYQFDRNAATCSSSSRKSARRPREPPRGGRRWNGGGARRVPHAPAQRDLVPQRAIRAGGARQHPRVGAAAERRACEGAPLDIRVQLEPTSHPGPDAAALRGDDRGCAGHARCCDLVDKPARTGDLTGATIPNPTSVHSQLRDRGSSSELGVGCTA